MWLAGEGRLLRRYRDGEAAIDGYAEDYASLICGLLELFQADGDAVWLDWAVALQERQDALFRDPSDGGWFSTTGRIRTSCCVSRKITTVPSRPRLACDPQPDRARPSRRRRAIPRAQRSGRSRRYGSRAGAAGACYPDDDGRALRLACRHTQVVIVGPPELQSTRELLCRGREALSAVRGDGHRWRPDRRSKRWQAGCRSSRRCSRGRRAPRRTSAGTSLARRR